MTTQKRTIKRVNADIARVVELITSLSDDLAAAPAHKRGTPWWNDRIQQRSQLLLKRDQLYAERREMTLAN